MKERLRRAAPWILAAVVGLSVLVRITVRDAVPVVAVLFYGLPPVAGAAVLLGASGAWLLQRRRRWAAAAMIAALLLGSWQVGISWFRPPQAPGELRVLLWNTQNGSSGWERLTAEIAAFEADAVCLVEAQKAPAALDGLDWRRLPGHMAVGLRGSIQATELVAFEPAGSAVVVRGTVRGRPLVLVIVDVGSNPIRPRGRAFETLEALLARVRPDVVAGDFNTPRDSVFFESWRPGFRHAFEAAGNGMDLTWPMPVPVLSLDHVWSGPRLAPRACRHEGSWASDHRAVVAEFSWVRSE